jgi:hypothetical protein
VMSHHEKYYGVKSELGGCILVLMHAKWVLGGAKEELSACRFFCYDM